VYFEDILGRLLEQHDLIERQAQQIEQLEQTVATLRNRLRASEERAQRSDRSRSLVAKWRF